MKIHTDEQGCPALSVEVVIFSLRDDRLQVLLIRQGSEPFQDGWALPGGFVQIQESLDSAALRELREKAGLQNVYLEQLYTYGDPDRDPRGRVISVAYFALIPADTPVRQQRGSGIREAAWFPVDDLPVMVLDHDEITTYALRRLRYKLEYSAVGFELLPEEFTLSQIQHTYQVILGEKLDKRNFRRRILEAGIIEPTDHLRTGEGRPARLYRYRADAVAEVKARRLFP